MTLFLWALGWAQGPCPHWGLGVGWGAVTLRVPGGGLPRALPWTAGSITQGPTVPGRRVPSEL